MWWIVYAESLDWCGCESDSYKVYADTEDEAIDIANANGIEDEVRDFYTNDEEDSEYIADEDIAITTKAEEYDSATFGELSEYKELK